MLISHSNKFIYVKTKKTAGSSIESIIVNNFFDHDIDICTGSKIDGTPRVNIGDKLPNQPDGHRPWWMVQHLVTDEQWGSYYKFTVERNPWDKVVSEYYWKMAREPQLNKYNNDIDNFRYFVENVFGKWYAAPRDWELYTYNNHLVVDQVIEYSKLNQQLVQMFNEKLNLPLTEEMISGTNKKSGYRKKHYTELYADDLIDIVANGYRKEIQQFGYKFGD